MRWLLAIAVLTSAPAVGRTEPALEVDTEPRHAVYVELLGRAGMWGLGYEYRRDARWSLGGAVSALEVDGRLTVTASPYVGLELATRGRHAWLAQAGAQLTHERIRSPVPEWDGDSATGIGAQLATGYEYRGPVLVRASLMLVAGRGGVAPWGGLTMGYRF